MNNWVLNSCKFSFFLEHCQCKEGGMSAGGVYMSDTNFESRYSVIVRLLVTNQVCNVFEVEIVLLCYAF